MAKSSFEISTFTSGVVGSPSETDIPNDAASYSKNINPVSEDGTLQAISNDQVLQNNEGFTTAVKTVQTLKVLRHVQTYNSYSVSAIGTHTDGNVLFTDNNHNLAAGDTIIFTASSGGAELNGQLVVLAAPSVNTFTVGFAYADLDTTPLGSYKIVKDISAGKQDFTSATIQATTYNSSYEELKYVFYFVQGGTGVVPDIEGYTSVPVAISATEQQVNNIAAALNTAINAQDGLSSSVSTDTITISPSVDVEAPLFYIPDTPDTNIPQQDSSIIEINTSCILPTITTQGKGTVFQLDDMAVVNMDDKVYTLFGINYTSDKIFKWDDIYNTNGENFTSEFASNITNDNKSTIQQRNKNLFIGLGGSEIFNTKWLGYIDSTQINKDITGWFLVNDKLDSVDESASPNNYDHIIAQQIHDNNTAFNEQQCYHAVLPDLNAVTMQVAFESGGAVHALGDDDSNDINEYGKTNDSTPKIGWCFKVSSASHDSSDNKLREAKRYKYHDDVTLADNDVFMVVDNTTSSLKFEYLGNASTTEPAFMMAIIEGTSKIYKISTSPAHDDFSTEDNRISSIDISEFIDGDTISTIAQCRSPLTSGASVVNSNYLYYCDGTIDNGHVSDQRCRPLHMMYWIGTTNGNLYRVNLTDFHSQHNSDTYKGVKLDAKMVLDYSNIARCQDSQYDGNFKHWYGAIYGAKRFNEYGYSNGSNIRHMAHDLENTDTTITESSGAWVESYSWSREPVNSNIAGIVETWNNATDTSKVPTAVRNNVAERYVYDDDTDSAGAGANPGNMTHHHAQTNQTGDLKDYDADKTIKIQSHANNLNHGFDTGNIITGFINKDGKGHTNYQGNTVITKVEGLNEFKAQGTHPTGSGNQDSFPYYSCKVWVLWKRKDGSPHEKWDLMLYNFYPTTVQSNTAVVYDRTPPYDECEKNIMTNSHGADNNVGAFWKSGDCNFYIQKSSMMLGKSHSEASNTIVPQSSSFSNNRGDGPNNIYVMRRDGSSISWECTGYYSYTNMASLIGFDGSIDGEPRLTTPFPHTLTTIKPLQENTADYSAIAYDDSLSFNDSKWSKGANKHQVCFASKISGKMAIDGFAQTWMLNDSEVDNSHSVRENQFKTYNDTPVLFKITDTGSAKSDTRTFAGHYASTSNSTAHTNNEIPWHYNNGGKFKKRCVYSTSDSAHISTRGSGIVTGSNHNLYYTSGTYSLYDGTKLVPTIVPFSNSSDTNMVQGQVGDYLYIDRKWLSGEPLLGTTTMYQSASGYIQTGESEGGTSYIYHRNQKQFRPYVSSSGTGNQATTIRGTGAYFTRLNSSEVNAKEIPSGNATSHNGERYNHQIIITSVKSAYSLTDDVSTAGMGGGDEYYYNQTDSRITTNRYSTSDQPAEITYDINRYSPGFEIMSYHAAEMRPFEFQGGPLDLIRSLQPIANTNMTYKNQLLLSSSSSIGGELTSTLSAYEDKTYTTTGSTYHVWYSDSVSGLLNKVDQDFYTEYSTHTKVLPVSLTPNEDVSDGETPTHTVWGSGNAKISNVNKQFVAPLTGEGYDYTAGSFSAFDSDRYIISNPLLTFSNEQGTGTELPNNANIKYKVSFLYDGYQESPLSNFFYDKTMTADKSSHDVTVNLDESYEFNPRITHIVIYRKNTNNDLYRLVKEVPLNSKIWINENGLNKFTFRDDKRFGSYAALTGINEERETTSLNYSLSAQINDELFVGLAWHKDAEDDVKKYIYKSKPGNFSQFDYKKDYLVLPNIPTALASFNGKIYAFDRNNTYVINPQQMFIEDTFEGVGCLSQDAFVVTEFGMCFADVNNIYLHNGSIAKPIGTNVLDVSTFEGYKLGWQKAVEYSEDTVGVNPFVFYDGPTNSFVCFVHGSCEEGACNNGVSRAWVYNISRNRWDYWEAPLVKKAIQGMDGDILISNGNLIYNYKKNTTVKDWKWLSKKLSLTKQTNTKRISRIKLQGTPTLDTISTPPKWNDDLVVYVDGDIQQLTIPNINPSKNKGFTKEFSGCFQGGSGHLAVDATTIDVTGLNESVTIGGKLPPVGSFILLNEECMLVTGNPTATSLTVTRAQLGTTAVEHQLVDSSTSGIEQARIFNVCPIIKLPSKCKGKNIELYFQNQKGIVDSFAIQFIDKGGK